MTDTTKRLRDWLREKHPDFPRPKDDDSLVASATEKFGATAVRELLDTPMPSTAILKSIVREAMGGLREAPERTDPGDPRVIAFQDQVKEYERQLGQILDRGTERKDSMSPTKSILMMGAEAPNGGDGVRVLPDSDRYRHERRKALHPKTGREVLHKGKPVEHFSQQENALLGAFWTQQAVMSGVVPQAVMTEHKQALLRELIAKHAWYGEGLHSETVRFEAGSDRVKALISDSTSGGSYINPVWFDDAIPHQLLLYSELFPRVDVSEMPRSNTVNSAFLSAPTTTWGTAEGSSLTAFTTTGLLSQITATVYPNAVGVEVGLDLLSDTPANIGDELVEVILTRMGAEMDKVIAKGDGTSQPQGIFNASGTFDVTIATPSAGPYVVGDLLELAFGVGKQYRQAGLNPAFLMTDTTYRVIRSIATGVSGDARLLFGMDPQSYRLLEYDVAINNDLSHDQLAFCCFKKYRLWRRQGTQTRWLATDAANALKNIGLMLVRARWAGKLIDGSAAAVCTSGVPNPA